ncbi:CU044_2847 family protein [Streptomyces griseosporeus]
MDDLVEFRTDSGASVVVVTDGESRGARPVSRGDGVLRQAGQTFDGALESIHSAAESALRVFRDGQLKPDAVEIEFGVKLTAEAGAVIAKTAMEGHLVVKLSWSPGAAGGTPAA